MIYIVQYSTNCDSIAEFFHEFIRVLLVTDSIVLRRYACIFVRVAQLLKIVQLLIEDKISGASRFASFGFTPFSLLQGISSLLPERPTNCRSVNDIYTNVIVLLSILWLPPTDHRSYEDSNVDFLLVANITNYINFCILIHSVIYSYLSQCSCYQQNSFYCRFVDLSSRGSLNLKSVKKLV